MLVLVALLAVVWAGCDSPPVAPERDNPLDPLSDAYHPPAAGGFSVTAQNGAVHLAWEKAQSPFITRVRIERANDDDAFVTLAELPADSLRFVDATGPFTVATDYRLSTISDAGDAEKVTPGDTVRLAIGRMGDVVVDTVTSHMLRLRWSIDSGLATHVRLLQQEGADWRLLDVLPRTTLQADIPVDIAAVQTLKFRLEMVHESEMEHSLGASELPIDLLAHFRPQHVQATLIDEARIEIEWQNVLEAAETIGVFRSRAAGLPQRIASLDPSDNRYVDESLLANNTSYRYSIRAEIGSVHTPMSESPLVPLEVATPEVRFEASGEEVVLQIAATPVAREHVISRSVDGGAFQEIARRPPVEEELRDTPPAGATRVQYRVRTLVSDARTIRLARDEGLDVLHDLDFGPWPVTSVNFSHDERLLGVTTARYTHEDGRGAIIDMSTGETVHDFGRREGGYATIAFTRAGDVITAGGGRGHIQMWNPTNWTTRWQRYVAGTANVIEFNQSDRLLIAPIIGLMPILDARTGAQLGALADIAHSDVWLGGKRPALSIDDTRLWTGSTVFGRYFEEWNVAGNTLRRTRHYSGPTVEHDVSRDGRYLAMRTSYATVILETSTLEEVSSLPMIGARFVGRSSDRLVGYQLDRLIRGRVAGDAGSYVELQAQINVVSASPDGAYIAVGMRDGRVRVFGTSSATTWFETF